MSLRVVPLELAEANGMVCALHRHLPKALSHRYSLGAVKDGVLVGAAIVGRPVSRGCPIRQVIEVTRCATDGTKNACSILYGAAARMAKAQGYHKIQTYNLDEEGGASLRAAGYVRMADVQGRPHVRSNGAPRTNANTDGFVTFDLSGVTPHDAAEHAFGELFAACRDLSIMPCPLEMVIE